MHKFQKQQPARSTGVASRSNYRDYLPQLASDFHNRCGYTNASHSYWGVRFQVDHFAPLNPAVHSNKKQAFLDGELTYENLVYACPQVNRAKWNDWPSDSPDKPILNDKGYYDPCSYDFNDHFYRTSNGTIMPKDGDKVAKYMWSTLKLHLARYALYWRFDLLKEKLDELHLLAEAAESDSDDEREILKMIKDFSKEIRDYEKYLDLNKNTLA